MDDHTDYAAPHPVVLYRALLTDEGRAALRQLNEVLREGEPGDQNVKVRSPAARVAALAYGLPGRA